MQEDHMATRGRPPKHEDARTRWREHKRRQRHPTLGFVPASQTPCDYVTDLQSFLATGQRFGCILAAPPWP
jgi:hypothetical protein